ncbi:hypothetical protein AOL_s00006g50 [Orbilia oligospora ATCC 24927]|uniref:Transcription factor domain-containing protein n=2 Tax=Orbilia oligospora TaxID=2813651 RepID=G1WZJ9_ARTOA|nr:hypothetical protein AOL_s00006g50 [Orbilia oligospora ATCC 24927]EGX53660.1 hypothetical protein AOL_s00006g50 [Orbilia oligospora ATCC 24927]
MQTWLSFQDESREIASEYEGGSQRYAPLEQVARPNNATPNQAQLYSSAAASSSSSAAGLNTETILTQPLPSMQPPVQTASAEFNRRHRHRGSTSSAHTDNSSTTIRQAPPPSDLIPTEPSLQTEVRSILNRSEETLFMQVFVEEVGIWMDTLDPLKHFSRLLPFHSLGEPMLLNALLACGAKHLSLVNPAYKEDRALHYYDFSTRLLLDALQNPDRDTVICAVTAVVLNVYEIMSERALQRMNHIAGARALIKECGWTALDTGFGGACFWINVTMELLSCLHFNWPIAWKPDDWGVNMDFTQDCEPGHEELWAYRMVYLLAKVADFRATIPRYTEPLDPILISNKTSERLEEWRFLKEQCETWDASVPRSMQPLSYLLPGETSSKSNFPSIWLLKRSNVVSRLFYHTAMVLLAQTHPLMTVEVPEMKEMAMMHAHTICGIVAPLKDRGIASVALRPLAAAAELLTVHKEQKEVIEIVRRISRETGWGVNFLLKELPAKWGWNSGSQQQHETSQAPPTSLLTTTLLNHVPASIPPPPGFNHSPSHFAVLKQSAAEVQAQAQAQVHVQALKQPAPPRRPPFPSPYAQGANIDPANHPYFPHYVTALNVHADRNNHLYF